ncbi:MAG: hypothetical protein WBA39_08085 [Rivularia sp. (in: cyanobacteria)]
MGRWGSGKPLRPRGFPDSTASGATRRGRWGDGGEELLIYYS